MKQIIPYKNPEPTPRKPLTREQKSARNRRCIIFVCIVVLLALIITIIAACTGGSRDETHAADPGQNAGNADSSANIDARHQSGEEEDLFPTREQIAAFERERALDSMVGLMVGNYVSIGTPINGYWNGGDADERAIYDEALVRAQAEIDQLPNKWILPDEVWIHLTGQNPVPLRGAQMENLREAYGFFTRGFGILPNYLQGLKPHIAAGFMGNLGTADSFWNDTSMANGHFGMFQLGPELYEAYLVWNAQGADSEELRQSIWRQCLFVWDVLNGWGYGSCITQDYSQTLADLLEAETAAEAAEILNFGKDGKSGFFRGANSERRIEWAEQIYAQLLEVRP